MVRNTAMQMVEADPASVEARLRAGEVSCVDCGGELRPWGWARLRTLRDHGRPVRLPPRRSRCRGCLVTHVLLPTLVFIRRADLAAVIGEALLAIHREGKSRQQVAAGPGCRWPRSAAGAGAWPRARSRSGWLRHPWSLGNTPVDRAVAGRQQRLDTHAGSHNLSAGPAYIGLNGPPPAASLDLPSSSAANRAVGVGYVHASDNDYRLFFDPFLPWL
jgi:hypothetical protein